jgi:hypothetical protein
VVTVTDTSSGPAPEAVPAPSKEEGEKEPGVLNRKVQEPESPATTQLTQAEEDKFDDVPI